ncbi:hypothetical protein V496_05434 [Pseudogymnoascus sp. VKM F-4515 (FW-2607)]|nr:hypothetical protein V496_05434 [Pseudogymnoascus sp. VKM F-4515 (FW-2607)]
MSESALAGESPAQLLHAALSQRDQIGIGSETAAHLRHDDAATRPDRKAAASANAAVGPLLACMRMSWEGAGRRSVYLSPSLLPSCPIPLD